MKYGKVLEDVTYKIREENMELFVSAEEMLEFSISAMADARNIGRNQTTDIIQAVSALYVKNLRLFRATLSLVEQGLISESFAITRIAFECLLYLMWINHDESTDIRTDRSYKLLAWQVVTRNKALNKLLGEAGEPDPRVIATFEKIKPYVDVLKEKMSEEEWIEYKEHGPYLPSGRLDALANEVGMLAAYNRIYKIGSEVIHCQDLLNYAERDLQTGGLKLNDWDDRHSEASLGFAIIMQFGSMAMTNRLLRLELTDRIRALNGKLRKQYPQFADLFPNGWESREKG